MGLKSPALPDDMTTSKTFNFIRWRLCLLDYILGAIIIVPYFRIYKAAADCSSGLLGLNYKTTT